MCSLPSFALHHESLLCTSLISIHSQYHSQYHSNASVLLEAAISKHSSSSFPASSFIDAFFAAYEDSGTAATTRGLHLLVHAYARLRLPGEALEACRYLAHRGVLPSLSAFNAALQ
ncbi:uncharacterized protein C2845_PM07G00260 [Panicum miliaceum]|uniref:Pentatricopeptide repeat-containing protein n=1 Tax=Panicum miliaceum TaxID=4540 RepID=A0A3L6SSP4_PANMI|nr:uncharacterized protein C2845_PM07G00260 [Panicum miliaceum]